MTTMRSPSSRRPLHMAMFAALLLLLLLFSEPVVSRDIKEVGLTDTNILCYEAACNSTTDLSCLCSEGAIDEIRYCIDWNATTYADYFTSLRLLDEDCGLPRRIDMVDPDYLGTGVGTFLVQTLFFGLRIVSRCMGVGKWGWDDHVCILAYITLIGQLIMNLLLDHFKYYQNRWTLDFWKIRIFWRINFARAVVYAVGLGLSKMSILFLYQRVFEGPRLKRVLIGTQVVNGLLTLSYVVATFLVSIPFECQFYLDSPEYCRYNDFWDGSGAYSAFNAALDVWMVVIPAVVVWRLQMKTGRKLSVIAIFATGICTCLIAIMRFILWRMDWSGLSGPVYQRLIWSNYYAYYVELTTCFVIACLPASRQLLGQKVWPEVKSRLSTLSISAWTSLRSGARNGGSSGSGGPGPLAGSSSSSSSSSSSRSSGYNSSSKRPGGGGIEMRQDTGKLVPSVAISEPVDGSFRHLTSHLRPEGPKEPKGGQVAYAL